MIGKKYLIGAVTAFTTLIPPAFAAAPAAHLAELTALRPEHHASNLSARGWTETKHETLLMNFNGMDYDVDVTWYKDANGNVKAYIMVRIVTPDGSPQIWSETWNPVVGGRQTNPYPQVRQHLDNNGNGIGVWNDPDDRSRLTPSNNN